MRYFTGNLCSSRKLTKCDKTWGLVKRVEHTHFAVFGDWGFDSWVSQTEDLQ